MNSRKSTREFSTSDMREGDFTLFMEKVLRTHYYRNMSDEYARSEGFARDLQQHLFERFSWAHDTIIPWLQTHISLDGMHLVEVGCGTGSSTLAFAKHVGQLECFEIDSHSIEVAEKRLSFWGVDNVKIRHELFSESVTVGTDGLVDGVILFATLEHMTLDEAISVLSLSWRTIRPGGFILVADTPNRFSPFDHHTSYLPFFAQLPRNLQVRYAHRSPREWFRQAIADALLYGEEAALSKMTRLGNGISYHEFELGIGDSIHGNIVLTGHEQPLTDLFNMTHEDEYLMDLFSTVAPGVNRAFTRPNLNFVIQKPKAADAAKRPRRA